MSSTSAPLVAAIGCGRSHVAMVGEDGFVYSWGHVEKLGRPSGGMEAAFDCQPGLVSIRDSSGKLQPCVQVACGTDHSLALTDTGDIYSWGFGKAGQLGHPLAAFERASLVMKVPERIPLDEPVHHIAATERSSSCRTASGKIFIWGEIAAVLYGSRNAFVPVEISLDVDLTKKGLALDCLALNSSTGISGTLREEDVVEEMASRGVTLKRRQTALSNRIRLGKKGIMAKKFGEATGSSIDISTGVEGASSSSVSVANDNVVIRDMITEVRKQIDKARKVISQTQSETVKVKVEIAQIGRELTLSEQKMAMLLEHGDQLEVQAQNIQVGGDSSKAEREREIAGRQVSTQMRDLQNFQDTNRRTRIGHLTRQSELESRLVSDEATLAQSRGLLRDLMNREQLLVGLASGGGGLEEAGEEARALRKGVNVAGSSMVDVHESHAFALALQKTEATTAGSSGAAPASQKDTGLKSFTGLMEVLQTSQRSLADTGSALKDISAACPGQNGAALEHVLELHIKIQKLTNALIRRKLEALDDAASPDSLAAYFKEPGRLSQAVLGG
ncbi:unnamed protein product [Amoebophrya sp. A25]|nr:unnamed protein product [Amoebophrya sp. A25]|eukprot:GSA25T00017260001.1